MKVLLTFLSLISMSMLSTADFVQFFPKDKQPLYPSNSQTNQAQATPVAKLTNCHRSFSFPSTRVQYILKSPSYPNSYPSSIDCRYSFNSPPGSRIQMNCTEFNLKNECRNDKFFYSPSGDAYFRDVNYLCPKGSFIRTSTNNALTVGFSSSSYGILSPIFGFLGLGNIAAYDAYKFSCIVEAVDSAVITTTTTTRVTSTATVVPLAETVTTSKETATAVSTTPIPIGNANTSQTNSTCKCGLRNEVQRIVGGSIAGENELPWRCSVRKPSTGDFCGGTLISDRWILTAAHCTFGRTKTDTSVHCGGHDISAPNGALYTGVKVSNIVQHPNYNDVTLDNDISLLELETPLILSKTIMPACLPWNLEGKSIQGLSVVASGWGHTSSDGEPSFVLKKVDLTALSTAECQKYYNNRGGLTSNMICTYNPGQDTCQGDSGGSIDYKDPSTGRYHSIGVVSGGYGCGAINEPGIYTYVNNYLKWIEEQTGENFCKA